MRMFGKQEIQYLLVVRRGPMQRNYIAAVLFLLLGLLYSTDGRSAGRCADTSDASCLRGFASVNYTADSNRCIPNVIAVWTSVCTRQLMPTFHCC